MSTVFLARNLRYRYGTSSDWVINGLDLHIQEGTIVGIMGPSGCGKSTLCCILGGVIPDMIGGELAGGLYFLGRELRLWNHRERVSLIGLVFQDPQMQLFSSTVEDEIAFTMENLCLPLEEMEQRMEEVLEAFGLTPYRHSSPDHLSGGMQQLLAIAAVAVMKPKVLLLDEALAQLDRGSRDNIKGFLCKLREQGTTILMVEHEEENLSIADDIFYLEQGQLVKKGMDHVIHRSNGYNL